jgi:hypothetical protein
LEKRAEQVLPGSDGGWDKGKGSGGRGREMAQTIYAHMNKCINDFKKEFCILVCHLLEI